MTLYAIETSLIDTLGGIVGPANVLTGTAMLALATDVYRPGAMPLAVVCPQSVAQVQAVVAASAAAGTAMSVRGGGASYTDGYTAADAGQLLIDMGALDAIVIDAVNGHVTVEAGVTWAALRDVLAAQDLRTPFWGPFSGMRATVGGSMSQNTISHGSAAYGISADSVLSFDIVTADGGLLSTGTAAAGALPFMRHFGPDLTGLFTGDCGTLGIKVRITLPVLRRRPAHRPISFAFPSFAAMHESMRLIAAERIEDTHFALDAALSQGQIARQDGVGAKLKIARELFAKAPNAVVGVKQLLRLALAGDKAMQAGEYMCHFIIEGVDATDALARANKLRAVMAPHGREIANSVPSFVRSLPFAPLTNILGPSGERWVPIHGVLPHDQVVPFHDALMALYAARKAEMERLGIWSGTMFSPAGSSGFLYEIALYWPDDRTDYHRHTLTPEHVAGLEAYAENEEARAYTHQLKADIIALYQQFGAAHFQIGRAYPYRERLDPQALTLLLGIKAALDPNGLMNPGALGL